MYRNIGMYLNKGFIVDPRLMQLYAAIVMVQYMGWL